MDHRIAKFITAFFSVLTLIIFLSCKVRLAESDVLATTAVSGHANICYYEYIGNANSARVTGVYCQTVQTGAANNWNRTMTDQARRAAAEGEGLALAQSKLIFRLQGITVDNVIHKGKLLSSSCYQGGGTATLAKTMCQLIFEFRAAQ